MFERSEFAHDPATREQRKGPRRGTVSGSPFLWLLSFGEAKESNSAAGPNPGLPRKPQPMRKQDMTATTVDISTIRINGDRLWSSLMELAQIGATQGQAVTLDL